MPARVLPGSNTISRRMLSLAGMRCRPAFNELWYDTRPKGAADSAQGAARNEQALGHSREIRSSKPSASPHHAGAQQRLKHVPPRSSSAVTHPLNLSLPTSAKPQHLPFIAQKSTSPVFDHSPFQVWSFRPSAQKHLTRWNNRPFRSRLPHRPSPLRRRIWRHHWADAA